MTHITHIDTLAELSQQRHAEYLREAELLRLLKAAPAAASLGAQATDPTAATRDNAIWPVWIRAAFSR